jgi:hypothetical protein
VHKEKIYEFNIEQPLSPARRKSLDKFLAKNAGKLKWPASCEWDEENDHLLHITVTPVKWEVWFAAHRVTVFGSGPFWARMLFTDKKRAMLREGILHVLKEAGFMTKAKEPKAKPEVRKAA